jgi:hypothetical protein
MAGSFGGVEFGGTTHTLGAALGPRSFTIEDDFATPEQRNGDPADPRHATEGEQAHPYPWLKSGQESVPHGPYGLDAGLMGFDVAAFETPAGRLMDDPTADLQPITRAAPYPKGVPSGVDPDSTEQRQAQSRTIHGMGQGAAREMLFLPTADPVQDQWAEIWDVDPGQSNQVPVPQQVANGSGGWGHRDRVQSQARQNAYGFDAAHKHRRFAIGSIPGNFMWLRPGSRPLVKSVPGTARIPTGPTSPFAGQDTEIAYDPRGAVLMDLPVQYTAPAEPDYAQSFDPLTGPVEVDYY